MSNEPIIDKKTLGIISIILPVPLNYVFLKIGLFSIFYLIFDLEGFWISMFIVIPLISVYFYLYLRKEMFKEEFEENRNELIWLVPGVYLITLINFIFMGLIGLGASIH